MKRSYVAVTGYYSTGSSAVIDLLKEYVNVGIASPVTGDYEHMAFYSYGALFDLISILSGKYYSPYGADVAINGFLKAANRLNENDFGWFGGYRKYYGNSYEKNVKEFISSISRIKERKSAAYIKETHYSINKVLKQIGAKIIYRRPIINLGMKYIYDDVECGYYYIPNKDMLYSSVKRYVKNYLEMCSNGKQINIFDHLVWPQQAVEALKLFPDDVKIIIVQRDPRDVYLLNKYYWHRPPVSIAKPYYPTDPSLFVEEWKQTIVHIDNNEKLLTLNFEDLIYNYDETVGKINRFLGLSKKDHVDKKKWFIPEKSIENTQIYECSDEWRKEVNCFAQNLEEYLYHYPYQRKPSKELWFDTYLQLDRIARQNVGNNK